MYEYIYIKRFLQASPSNKPLNYMALLTFPPEIGRIRQIHLKIVGSKVAYPITSSVKSD